MSRSRRHIGVVCDGCEDISFAGIRYKCSAWWVLDRVWPSPHWYLHSTVPISSLLTKCICDQQFDSIQYSWELRYTVIKMADRTSPTFFFFLLRCTLTHEYQNVHPNGGVPFLFNNTTTSMFLVFFPFLFFRHINVQWWFRSLRKMYRDSISALQTRSSVLADAAAGAGHGRGVWSEARQP